MTVGNIIRTFKRSPGYATMRGAARFPSVRRFVTDIKSTLSYQKYQPFVLECEDKIDSSFFKDVDRKRFVEDLESDGLAFGLTLPKEAVSEIQQFARDSVVYADRDPKKGFYYSDREIAENKLGKTILVAQYFNARQCGVIDRLVTDPFLNWVAASYLKSVPTFVGCNLWWTSPVQASEEDRNKHAHLYHRDVDDYRFFKFFFYITDVKNGEGAHVCVRKSVRNPPRIRPMDRWLVRRYADDEINNYYPPSDILEIIGQAGTGFAEDTLCIHKGSTPKSEPRLLLQLQFALFDYGITDDNCPAAHLELI